MTTDKPDEDFVTRAQLQDAVRAVRLEAFEMVATAVARLSGPHSKEVEAEIGALMKEGREKITLGGEEDE